MIDPCLPRDLKVLDIKREYRGNTYQIHIENKTDGEKGKVSVKVNGQAVEGQIIPAPKTVGEVYSVSVTVE